MSEIEYHGYPRYQIGSRLISFFGSITSSHYRTLPRILFPQKPPGSPTNREFDSLSGSPGGKE